MLKVFLKSKNSCVGNALINIFAYRLVDETCNTRTWLTVTCSQRKGKSISTCLVLWCYTGLDVKYIASALSEKTTIAWDRGNTSQGGSLSMQF